MSSSGEFYGGPEVPAGDYFRQAPKYADGWSAAHDDLEQEREKARKDHEFLKQDIAATRAFKEELMKKYGRGSLEYRMKAFPRPSDQHDDVAAAAATGDYAFKIPKHQHRNAGTLMLGRNLGEVEASDTIARFGEPTEGPLVTHQKRSSRREDWYYFEVDRVPRHSQFTFQKRGVNRDPRHLDTFRVPEIRDRDMYWRAWQKEQAGIVVDYPAATLTREHDKEVHVKSEMMDRCLVQDAFLKYKTIYEGDRVAVTICFNPIYPKKAIPELMARHLKFQWFISKPDVDVFVTNQPKCEVPRGAVGFPIKLILTSDRGDNYEVETSVTVKALSAKPPKEVIVNGGSKRSHVHNSCLPQF